MRAKNFVAPALFLLCLGTGNLWVGSYRAAQHREILAELTEVQLLPDVVNTSPLMRIQLTEFSNEKLRQKYNKALSRLNFYRLVENGGKVLVLCGMFVSLAGLLIAIRRDVDVELHAHVS